MSPTVGMEEQRGWWWRLVGTRRCCDGDGMHGEAAGTHRGHGLRWDVCKCRAAPRCWALQPPPGTDRWTDGQTERGASQGDNRTGWWGSVAATRDRMAAWLVGRMDKVADGRRGGRE